MIRLEIVEKYNKGRYSSNMKIYIDQRIELMTVIQTLCDYWDNLSINWGDGEPLFRCKYKDEISKYFEKDKYLEILDFYNKICNDETDINSFLDMILCHSEPPELNIIADYSRDYDTNKFIDLMRKFYFDSDFSNFFNNNKNEYDKMINDIGFCEEEKIIETTQPIFNYLGTGNKNYDIIISPLVFGNFGVKINQNNLETKNYVINSPFGYKENKYIFYTPLELKYNWWHEISHTVINDLIEKYIHHFDIDNMVAPDIFRKHFYTNIETVTYEYIIRAITLRVFELFDKDVVPSLINHETGKGFTEVEKIKNYIVENCEKNNTLIKDDMFKELVEFVIKKAYCV
jgi:hypothetical protein